MKPRHVLLSLVLAAGTAAAVPPGYEPDPQPESVNFGSMSDVPCVDGFATVNGQEFHCENVDVLSYLPLHEMGCAGFTGNDIWGWTDPDTDKEYALMGCTNGTSFVDVSDPLNPVHVGFLPSNSVNPSTWRDIKVYDDHAFVVCDGGACSSHGLQVLDLTELRDFAGTPITFSHTAHGASFGNAHNIAINEDTGYAYVVGANQCSGGLHILDINDPTDPQVAGCYSAAGYTHDTQCVIYQGPDEDYQGQEICFNSNGNSERLVIVDVTDKNALALISSTPYTGSSYTHQGWLTEDHHYFLLDDETDEGIPVPSLPTRTYIWDVSDLDDPQQFATHQSSEIAIDHNQYVKGTYTYQSNYTAGLRILDLSDIADGNLTEIAYFNFMPHTTLGPEHDKDGDGFAGTWSNYPYFESGVVIVSVRGINGEPGGLWTVQPRLAGISGTVTRDDTGAPLEGAQVSVVGPVQVQGVTGADGGYRIDTTPGTYEVTVSMEGFPDETETAVETTEGGHTTVDFVLETPPGELQVSPSAHDFGEVGAGQLSAPLEVTVSNAVPEPARALGLSGIEITGDPEFSIIEGGTCDGDTQLAPLESCTVEVIFSPDLSGEYAGEINVAADDGQSASVSVSGTGLASEPAVLAVEPASISFGDVFVGDMATATLTISNAAEGDAADLLLTQLEVIAGKGAFTRVGGTCAEHTVLAPGGSCTVEIQFSPDAPTVFSGVFRAGVDGEHRNVTLSGNGTEPEPTVFEDRFEAE